MMDAKEQRRQQMREKITRANEQISPEDLKYLRDEVNMTTDEYMEYTIDILLELEPYLMKND